MSDHVAFPDPPDQIGDPRRARELEHRLKLLREFASVVAMRANMHASLAVRHGGYWLGDWETQKAGRFVSLASILASPEFAAFIRGHVGLRDLFSRDPAPPLPKRPRVPNKRKSRAKPKPVEDEYVDPFDLTKWTWPEFPKL